MFAAIEPISSGHSPFDVLTFIVAPALLTNATSVLAMSTINRMLRTRDRMQELFAEFKAGGHTPKERELIVEQVDRVEKQAVLLLRALHAIYVSLGSFAGATLVTLLGASLAIILDEDWFRIPAVMGILLGALGVGGLIFGSSSLLNATRISLVNLRSEAALIREHYHQEHPDSGNEKK